jgi:hypothetical protein
MFAAHRGFLDTCRLLVERKADLTVKTEPILPWDWCPQPSRALLVRANLTPFAAASKATLPCDVQSERTTPPSWRICAASGRQSELKTLKVSCDV